MKKYLLASLWNALLFLPLSAHAQQEILQQSSYDWARVIRVEPVVTEVEVHVQDRECREREIRTEYDGPRHSVTGSTLVGGLLGGLIGNGLGHGRGRPAATVGGAILGGVIGGTMAEHSNRYGEYEEIRHARDCRPIDRVRNEERLDGYRVEYEYRGEVYRTRLPYRPEGRIRVRVTTEPVAP